MLFQFNTVCPHTGFLRRIYHLSKGITSIGCSKDDNICIPEIMKKSISNFKIDGQQIWIKQNIPGNILVNGRRLHNNGWFKLTNNDELKLDVVYGHIQMKISEDGESLPPGTRDLWCPKYEDIDPRGYSEHITTRSQSLETVLSSLDSTLLAKSAPILSKDSDFLEATQSFNSEERSKKLNTDALPLPPTQVFKAISQNSDNQSPDIDSDFLEATQSFNSEERSKKLNTDALPLSPTQVFKAVSQNSDNQSPDIDIEFIQEVHNSKIIVDKSKEEDFSDIECIQEVHNSKIIVDKSKEEDFSEILFLKRVNNFKPDENRSEEEIKLGSIDNVNQKGSQGYNSKRKNEVKSDLSFKKSKTEAENALEIDFANKNKPSTSYALRKREGKKSSFEKLDRDLSKSKNAFKSHAHKKLAHTPYILRDRRPKKSECNGKTVERSSKSKKVPSKPKSLDVTSKMSKSCIRSNENKKLRLKKSKSPAVIQPFATPVIQNFYPGASTSQNSSSFKLMFTGDDFEEEYEIVKNLGAEVVNSAHLCTHLIANKVKRTLKFLCCIAKGVPIVSQDWLFESKKSGKFIDHIQFLLKDEYAENLYKFQLKKSLELAKVKPLLSGYNIFIATEMIPSSLDMRSIIEFSGGNVLMNLPSGRSRNVIIIADEQRVANNIFLKDKLVRSLKNHSFKIVTPEFILVGLLQYKLNFKKYGLRLK